MHCVLLTWHSSRVRTLGKLLVDECEGKRENRRLDGELLSGFTMRSLPRSLTAGLIVPAKGKNWWAVPTLLTVSVDPNVWLSRPGGRSYNCNTGLGLFNLNRASGVCDGSAIWIGRYRRSIRSVEYIKIVQ